MAHVVEYLLSKHGTVSSNPSTTKNKNKLQHLDCPDGLTPLTIKI
jgi:hypothetical protein